VEHKAGKSRKPDSKTTAAGKPKVEWQGYVTIEITESQKRALQKFVAEKNDPIAWLDKILMDATYSLKVDYDNYNNCWRASFYCQKYGHVNAGWNLPARAATIDNAIRRLCFIHSEVLQGAWVKDNLSSGWSDEKW